MNEETLQTKNGLRGLATIDENKGARAFVPWDLTISCTCRIWLGINKKRGDFSPLIKPSSDIFW